jgi:hypothetical protein
MCWCKIVRSLGVVMTVMIITSCEIVNPAEDVPSYVHVESFNVTTDVDSQGSASSNIHDVWVTVDGKDLGAFELPATVPILAEGNHSVVLRAGILINGIAATRSPYPFYTHYQTTYNLQSAKIENLAPTVTYASYVTFAQNEDFDHAGISFDTTSASDTSFNVIQDANSMEGKYGFVYLDGSHPRFYCESHSTFDLPAGNAAVYVELNYKCNTEFVVGTIANNGSSVYVNDQLVIRATETWKKIYVNLTTAASSIPFADWRIFIRATMPDGMETAQLYFDNIKVVH